MLFCGLDVGTSGVKAVVFDEKGEIRANCFRAYELALKNDGTRDLMSDQIWEKTKEVLRGAAAECGGDISSVAVSSFGEAFVPIDKDGKALSEVMLFTDRRGEKEFYEAKKATSDDRIAELIGVPPSTMYSLPKILYIKYQRPETYEKTCKFLLIEDFIYYMLCGETYTDYSLAGRTMLFDVNTLKWSEEMMGVFGIDPSMFSTPVCSGTVIGTVSGHIASELGLKGDVKLVMGGHDQPVHAFGAGDVKGQMVCSMGTSECVTPVFDKRLSKELTLKRGLSTEPFVREGRFCTLAFNATSGLLVKWFFDAFEGGEQKYAEYEANAPAGVSRLFVQPYLMGSGTPYLDPNDRYAVIGADIGTTKYEIYKASLEGLCLDQRMNIEYLKEEGMDYDTLICAGGGSRSDLWLQTKANVLQMQVKTLKGKEMGALGCAMLCAIAVGAYSDPAEAAAQMSHTDRVFSPDASLKAAYDEKFALYKSLKKDIEKYNVYASRTNWQ